MRVTDTPENEFFLPDFCDLPVVFAVVVLSELFAFVITLAPLGRGEDFWLDLAVASLFIQWVSLIGAALLCLLRPWLRRVGNRSAALFAWLLLVAMVGVFSHLAVALADTFGVAISTGIAEFVLRNLAIGAILSAITLRYFYVQHQWQRRLKAESEARIQALQARIRPHFLFNSMNTIASLVRSDPSAAEAAVEDLADLFRSSLADARRLITLGEELELCRRYAHMEGLRLGPRLQVEWDVAGLPAEAAFPALTLQPLIENAVYHGIEPLPEGGTVRVSGVREQGRLRLRVENPVSASTAAAHRAGNRLALDNIRERLAAHFGPSARLENALEDSRYRVELTLPYEQASKGAA